MQIQLLNDFSRMQEIYDFRIFCWENSSGRASINRKKYPQGLKDDIEEISKHFIIEEEGKIIAAARASILENIEDVCYKDFFIKYNYPTVKPFGFQSRLVIHPEHRGKGYSKALDQIRMNYFETSKVRQVIAVADQSFRVEALKEHGFKILGIETPPDSRSDYVLVCDL